MVDGGVNSPPYGGGDPQGEGGMDKNGVGGVNPPRCDAPPLRGRGIFISDGASSPPHGGEFIPPLSNLNRFYKNLSSWGLPVVRSLGEV